MQAADCARFELAGRQGVFAAALENANKDNELRRKPFDRSDLAAFGFWLWLSSVRARFRIFPVQ
jgi:hypothetical protein